MLADANILRRLCDLINISGIDISGLIILSAICVNKMPLSGCLTLIVFLSECVAGLGFAGG